tara:strand:- start:729 stop:839 length:111 start_codon:yes stop_codon:yes gene_type:complete
MSKNKNYQDDMNKAMASVLLDFEKKTRKLKYLSFLR